MVKSLQKATLGYLDWKSKNKPHWKPWHFPEQICSPRLNLVEVISCFYPFLFFLSFVDLVVIVQVCRYSAKQGGPS